MSKLVVLLARKRRLKCTDKEAESKMPEPGTKIKYLKADYVYIILNEIKRQIKN